MSDPRISSWKSPSRSKATRKGRLRIRKNAGGADLFLLQLRIPVQDDIHLRRTAFSFRLFDTDEMLAVGHDSIVVAALLVAKPEQGSRRTGGERSFCLDRDSHQCARACDDAAAKK